MVKQTEEEGYTEKEREADHSRKFNRKEITKRKKLSKFLLVYNLKGRRKRERDSIYWFPLKCVQQLGPGHDQELGMLPGSPMWGADFKLPELTLLTSRMLISRNLELGVK